MKQKKQKKSPKLMLIGPAILAVLCVVLGVFSLQIFGVLASSFRNSQHAASSASAAWQDSTGSLSLAMREVADEDENELLKHGAAGSQCKTQRWSTPPQASQNPS